LKGGERGSRALGERKKGEWVVLVEVKEVGFHREKGKRYRYGHPGKKGGGNPDPLHPEKPGGHKFFRDGGKKGVGSKGGSVIFGWG